MLKSLPASLKGSIIFLLVVLNTLFWTPVLLVGAILKIILPVEPVKKAVTKTLIWAATMWVSFNSALIDIFNKVEWVVTEVEGLSNDEWYLVNCNHQSWTDIPVVQKVLNGKVPMLKFFLKKELIWVPVIGLCWWALDFPFMKRYSAEMIRKNPQLAGKDLETTRQACEKFKTIPVSVFNFMEGTRYTKAKHERQQSPFANLLKPKAGGTAFVLGSMGAQMNTMLDINIVYPDGDRKTPWDLCCGRITKIVVDIRTIDIPKEFIGKDYANDPVFKADFQAWLNEFWVEKDRLLTELKKQHALPAPESTQHG
ncbi:MAG: acyltransferase [Gammaproteobacteria bacterium]|nr:MAG: acyltransferase [Pseudomonadota bacterium]PIE38804.1 MAG: acyltransferase [Gammaproteobacteria bacterium]